MSSRQTARHIEKNVSRSRCERTAGWTVRVDGLDCHIVLWLEQKRGCSLCATDNTSSEMQFLRSVYVLESCARSTTFYPPPHPSRHKLLPSPLSYIAACLQFCPRSSVIKYIAETCQSPKLFNCFKTTKNVIL